MQLFPGNLWRQSLNLLICKSIWKKLERIQRRSTEKIKGQKLFLPTKMKEFRLLNHNKGSYPSLTDVFKCMRGYPQKEIKQLLHLESAEARGNDKSKKIKQQQDLSIRELKSSKPDMLKVKGFTGFWSQCIIIELYCFKCMRKIN